MLKLKLFIFFSWFGLYQVAAQNSSVSVLTTENIFDAAPFASCHASTLVALNDNKIMCAWFGGKHEGSSDVSIWSSTNINGKWSVPVEIANGIANDGLRYPCWNPVLFKAKNGLLYLHFKVGQNPRNWWAEYKVSNNDGKSWSSAKKLPTGFLEPIKNKPVQLGNGSILYPSSTESLDEKTWKIHIEKTDANGTIWRKIQIDCDTFGVIQPSILTYENGKIQLLCRSRQNVIVESWSVDNGETWSKLKPTKLPNPNSGSDAVSLKNNVQLLIYNPLESGKNWWEGRSVLKLATSINGIDWKNIYTFENHQDGEYSYPAIIQSTTGDVFISYTALRKRIKFVKLRIN